MPLLLTIVTTDHIIEDEQCVAGHRDEDVAAAANTDIRARKARMAAREARQALRNLKEKEKKNGSS